MRSWLSAALPVCRDGRAGLLTIVLAAVLWGTVGVSTRAVFSLTETSTLTVAFLRLALSLPVLGIALVSILGRRGLVVKPRLLAPMAAIGILLALYQLCFYASLQRVGVAVATLVTLCTAPVIVAIVSTALLGERPTRGLILAVGLAILGTVLLAGPADAASAARLDWLGVLLALGSASGYALVAIISRGIARHAQPLTTVTVGFAAGTLALLPALVAEAPRLDFPPAAWALLVYLGVVPTALGYVLFASGVRTVPATVASVVTLVEPLTAALLAWLLFDERLGPLALVGAVLLLVTVVLLARGETPA